MKLIALLLFLVSTQSFACDKAQLRRDVFSLFSKGLEIQDPSGTVAATTTLREMSLTDNMLRIRGEDFFLTRLLFDVVWAGGVREEKEILLAAIVDVPSCRIESFEGGELFGSSASPI